MKNSNGSSTLRPFGQRTILVSTPRLSKSMDVAENAKIKSTKNPVSLSDFLDRKLGKANSSTGSGGGKIPEKKSSFSLFGSGSTDVGIKNGGPISGQVLDGSVFKQFNCTAKEASVVLSKGADGEHDSKKRKNPFAYSSGAGDDRPSALKYLVVLGDNPKPRHKRLKQSVIEDKPKPLFNHYANGSGWWDCDREGVDNEEVGCNEPWEGMGSTTLGGLEWH